MYTVRWGARKTRAGSLLTVPLAWNWVFISGEPIIFLDVDSPSNISRLQSSRGKFKFHCQSWWCIQQVKRKDFGIGCVNDWIGFEIDHGILCTKVEFTRHDTLKETQHRQFYKSQLISGIVRLIETSANFSSLLIPRKKNPNKWVLWFVFSEVLFLRYCQPCTLYNVICLAYHRVSRTRTVSRERQLSSCINTIDKGANLVALRISDRTAVRCSTSYAQDREKIRWVISVSIAFDGRSPPTRPLQLTIYRIIRSGGGY